MKRMLALLALCASFAGAIAPATATAFADASAPILLAQAPDAKAPAAPAAAPAAATATPAAATAAPAPAAAEPAAAAAPPTPNKGDNAWMIVATLLVIMMSIPGLALFYGGLVRSKNMLSVLMQVFVIFSLITVLWAVYGYSVAFTEDGPFFGGVSRLFLSGIFTHQGRRRVVRDRGDIQQGRRDPRVPLRRLPGDVRGDHRGADRRSVRRADEVRGGAAVRRAVVHVRLPADRAHGLVLAGPGRHQGCGDPRLRIGEGRLAVAEGRARLRRRHGRPHQRGHRGPRRRVRAGQARRLRPRFDGAAQPDVHDDRRIAAVGGLVRLQRRIGARSRATPPPSRSSTRSSPPLPPCCPGCSPSGC